MFGMQHGLLYFVTDLTVNRFTIQPCNFLTLRNTSTLWKKLLENEKLMLVTSISLERNHHFNHISYIPFKCFQFGKSDYCFGIVLEELVLTIYHTIPTFNDFEKEAF